MLFGGGYAAFSGPSASKKITQTPPINASSPDEENFIQYGTPPHLPPRLPPCGQAD